MNHTNMTMSIEAVDFVTTQLDEPVRQFCLDLLMLNNKNDDPVVEKNGDMVVSTLSLSASARVDRFEIAVRTDALHRMSGCCSTSKEDDTAGIMVVGLQQLIRQVVAAVCHVLYFAEQHYSHSEHTMQEQQQRCYTNLKEMASPLRKVPVTLLEDMLDTLSLSHGYAVWQAACSSSSSLTARLFFGPILWGPLTSNAAAAASKTKQVQPPIWLPFLKCANKFLRRLQAQHSLPLTTSTSRTTTGANNHSNSGSGRVSAAVAAADVLQTLSRVYPLSEKSATRLWGSHNTDHWAVLASEDDFACEQQQQANETPAKSTVSAATTTTTTSNADYSLYETFWTLQHDFRNPNSVVVADFLHRLKTVLRTFQSHAPVEAAVAVVPVTDHDSSNGQQQQQLEQQLHLLIQPYLTHSRLLTIQLTDPMMRAVILLQFQMVAQHLMSQVPPLRVQLQPHLDAARHQLGLVLPQQQELVVQTILERSEPQWRTWKQNKCQPDLEATVMPKKSENGTAHNVMADSTLSRKRRKRSAHLLRDAENGDADEQQFYAWNTTSTTTSTITTAVASHNDGTHSHLQSVAHAMRTAVPSTTDHLEDYVDALDPDAGIEPEYHPKHDAVYGWRAMRLLASSHLADFANGVHPNGDFEPLVRNVYRRDHGVDIPGTGPERYQEPDSSADEKDDDNRMEDETKQPPDPDEEQDDHVMEDSQAIGETDDDDIGIGEADDEEEIPIAPTVENDMQDENGTGGEDVAEPIDAEEDDHQRDMKPPEKEPKIDVKEIPDSALASERDNGEKKTGKDEKLEQNGDASRMGPSKDDERRKEAFRDSSKNSRPPSTSHHPMDAPHTVRKLEPLPSAAAPPHSRMPGPGQTPPPPHRSDAGGYNRNSRPSTSQPSLHNSDYRRDSRLSQEDHHPANPIPRGRSVDDRRDRRSGSGGGGGDRGGGDDRVGGRPDDRVHRDRDSGVGREGVGHRGNSREYGNRRDNSRGRRGGGSGGADRNRR